MDTQPLRIDPAMEHDRIARFLNDTIGRDRTVAIGLSGGIDSDVVARLAVATLGAERVRAFTVLEANMDPRHLANARATASSLGLVLRELSLGRHARELLEELARVELHDGFSGASALDLGKAQNSLRTWVLSMYIERGHVVLGTANRTEIVTGFYLPFGDGLCHLQPIGHLYKSEVRALSLALGTSEAVREQPASAGYWRGQTDLEDLAYWLVYGAPAWKELRFDGAQLADVRATMRELSFESIDVALALIETGADDGRTSARAGLSEKTVRRVRALRAGAMTTKGLPLHRGLPRLG